MRDALDGTLTGGCKLRTQGKWRYLHGVSDEEYLPGGGVIKRHYIFFVHKINSLFRSNVMVLQFY